MLLLSLLIACGPKTAPVHPAATTADSELRAPDGTPLALPRNASKLAEAAEYYVSHVPKGFRDDCGGFVEAVYARAGLELLGGPRSMWDLAQELGVTHTRKRPNPGDLVFFDDTFDRNGDGKRNDPLTHIGVVISVQDDGTVLFAHGNMSDKRVASRMNLLRPTVYTHDGAVLNDFLRRRDPKAGEGQKRLAGQLFHGFASLTEP